MVEETLQAMRRGAYDYIQKPVDDIDLFLTAIQRALEKHRLSVERRELIRSLQQAQWRLGKQRANELELIHRIGLALGSALERDEIISVAHDALESLIGCDVLGFWIVGPELGTREFLVHSRRPLDEQVVGQLRAGLEGWVSENGMAASSARDLPFRLICGSDRTERDDRATLRILALVKIVPLILRDHLRGLVLVGAERQREYSVEEEQLMSILIDQTAAAIEKASLFDRMSDLAIRDGLTSLYNWRHFYELLRAEVRRAERYGGPFSVVMIDSDILKPINDTYGHPAGDEFIRQVGCLIRDAVRTTDHAARYGGDEFGLILPQTGRAAAFALAERLRLAVEGHDFSIGDEHLRPTISLGVSTFVQGKGMTAEDVVTRADRALYEAKEKGKNRVCVFGADRSSFDPHE